MPHPVEEHPVGEDLIGTVVDSLLPLSTLVEIFAVPGRCASSFLAGLGDELALHVVRWSRSQGL